MCRIRFEKSSAIIHSFIRGASQEPCFHWLRSPFHQHWATVREPEIRVMVLVLQQTIVSSLGYVNLARLARGFRSRCQIDSVAEQTVSRHSLANHSRHHFTTMNANGQLLMAEKGETNNKNQLNRTRINCTTYDSLQIFGLHLLGQVHNVQSQAGNASGMRFTWFRQTGNGHILVAHCFHLSGKNKQE